MTDCARIRDRFFLPGEPLDRRDPLLAQHLADCPACRRAAAALERVDGALATLRSAPPLPVPPFEAIAAGARVAARGRRRRAFLRRAGPFAATGAAAAAAAVLLSLLASGGEAPGLPLALPGSTLDAATGGVRVRLAHGASVRVESGQVTVEESPGEESLRLAAGKVSLEVPKLARGRTLSVRTPEADVRVRGTRFSVARDEAGTTVSVAEGKVEVAPRGSASVLLGPGESTKVESTAARLASAKAEAAAALERGDAARARERLSQIQAIAPDAPPDAEVEAMRAWTAASSGDRAQAISGYRRALDLLPDGARALWADNACAELALLLEAERPSEAPQAWRECLRRFPAGVHADLARSRLQARGER